MDTKSIIKRLHDVHGNRYQYDIPQSTIHPRDMVGVVCATHGKFTTKLHDHLYNKSGCPSCGNVSKRTNFVERAIAKHGDTYDYSNVVYKNSYSHVTIICKDHGPFDQMPAVHLSANIGCPVCKVSARTSTTSEFVDKATVIHGTMYDYTSVNYVNCKSPVNIICSTHGEFSQTPDNHLRGSGCPKCAGDTLRGKYVAGYYCAPDKRGNLYIVRMSNCTESFLKIGITTRQNVKYRYGNNHAGYRIDYLRTVELPIRTANSIEQQLLQHLTIYRYRPLIKFGGYTECVDVSIEIIDSILLSLLGKEVTQ